MRLRDCPGEEIKRRNQQRSEARAARRRSKENGGADRNVEEGRRADKRRRGGGTERAQMRTALERSRVPAVWINAAVPGPVVKPDDRACGRIAAEHLLAQGHRRIAYADFANDPEPGAHFSVFERRAGYADALRAAGLDPRFRGNPLRLPHSSWRGLAAAWLAEPEPPSAVVCYSLGTAMHLMIAALAECGLRVPGDLSLVVIADDTYVANNLPIDAVVLPWREVGARAVDLLLAAIAGGEATPLPDPPGRLVPAGSSAPPAA